MHSNTGELTWPNHAAYFRISYVFPRDWRATKRNAVGGYNTNISSLDRQMLSIHRPTTHGYERGKIEGSL